MNGECPKEQERPGISSRTQLSKIGMLVRIGKQARHPSPSTLSTLSHSTLSPAGIKTTLFLPPHSA